jgi:ribosome-associated protein
MTKRKKNLSSKELVNCAVAQALEKKAENIVLFNLGETSGLAEWVMIGEGSVPSHTRAIADSILTGCKEYNAIAWQTEGLEDGRWILLDYSNLLVCIMLPELRKYYDLEKLWKEFPRTDIAAK